ncbi:MAG: hypothetical protein IJQ90_04420 [Alphaproteobacteria bacterium]|nr:hypothetical protein [Alphaproteobacteria bacterium]
MNAGEKNFHTDRRAFIIMPDTGLTVAPVGFSGGHTELLVKLHYPRLRYAMDNFPRGYFMNDELCIYTGHDMTPGAVWEIKEKDMYVVKNTIPDFRRVFSVNDETPVYLGVRVGEIGKVWEKIRRTTIKMLEKGNIVM